MSEPNTVEWYSEWVNELEAALANERASNALLEVYNATLEAERDAALAKIAALGAALEDWRRIAEDAIAERDAARRGLAEMQTAFDERTREWNTARAALRTMQARAVRIWEYAQDDGSLDLYLARRALAEIRHAAHRFFYDESVSYWETHSAPLPFETPDDQWVDDEPVPFPATDAARV